MKSSCLFTKNGLRPKILFLPRWYPYLEDPTFGLFIERHARCICHLADVKVLFVHPVAGLTPGLHFRRENRNGIDTLCIHYNSNPSRNRSINLLRSLVNYLRAQYLGYKLLYPGAEKPDICHVHVLTRPAFLALWLHLFRGIPYIITEHWSRYHQQLNRYNGFFRKKATSLIARHASAITAVSAHLRTAMQQCRIINPNFQLIPNVVDTDIYFSNHPPQPLVDRTVMVHISTFEDASKNISGLLRTTARLAAVRNDFSLRIVGDGIDFAKMKELAASLGLSYPTVEFAGLANNEQVVHHLNQASFLVMFSNYENQPVVIIESFACGRPVVATRVGGIPELVNDQMGILIDPENEDQLATAIIRMIDNYSNYNSQTLRSFATCNFSPAIVATQLMQLYYEALHLKFPQN